MPPGNPAVPWGWPERVAMPEVYSTNARWFNGRDPRPRMALVRIHGQHLELVPHSSESTAAWSRDSHDTGLAAAMEGAPRRYHRQRLKVGERWRGTPVPVQLPDGGSLLLSADSALAKALAPQSLAARLMGRWSAVAASLVLLLVLLTGAALVLNLYGRTAWEALVGAVSEAVPADVAAAAPAPAALPDGVPEAPPEDTPEAVRA